MMHPPHFYLNNEKRNYIYNTATYFLLKCVITYIIHERIMTYIINDWKNCSTNGRGRIAHLKNEGEEELHFQHSNREILK